MRPAEQGELARLRAVVATVTDLHQQETNPDPYQRVDWCIACGRTWPCPTTIAIRDADTEPSAQVRPMMRERFVARRRARRDRWRVDVEWCGSCIGRMFCRTHATVWDDDGSCPWGDSTRPKTPWELAPNRASPLRLSV